MRYFVPFKSHSPADQVREALDRAERRVVSLRGTGPGALDILYSFDYAMSSLAEIEASGADVRAERSKLETVLGQFRRKQNLFLREVGDALQEERASVDPDRDRWWWYIDEIVAEQRKERVTRLLKRALVAVVVLLIASFVYDRFIAPPEYVREGLHHTASGEALVDQGDLRSALAEFEAAAAANPDDAGAWIWIGVINSEMGEMDAADDAFAKGRALSGSNTGFLLKRGQTYQRLGNTEAAVDDVNAALAEDPDSGWAYVLRGNIYAQMGDFDAAMADLDKAGELASASGDVQLEAYARTQRAMVVQQRMVPQMLSETPTPE